MADTQADLLWRWEVKKVSCLGDLRAHGTAVRAWFKQVSSACGTGNTGWLLAAFRKRKASALGLGSCVRLSPLSEWEGECHLPQLGC